MSLPVIVTGGGGHAKVLIDSLLALSIHILGFTDRNAANMYHTIRGIRMLGDDGAVLWHRADSIRLVNGIGSTGPTNKREEIFEYFKSLGYIFAAVIHPASAVSRDVEISEGAQIMAGAIIQPGSRIGKNTIVNTKASVDHDCLIGDHVHLAPGVTLSGKVKVGSGAHVGTGATVIQGVNIGQKCLIGAGALVLGDIPAGCAAVGVPARIIQSGDMRRVQP